MALFALFGAPVLSDNAYGCLLHHLDHLLELFLVQGCTQSLSLLLPQQVASCEDYAVPTGPLEYLSCRWVLVVILILCKEYFLGRLGTVDNQANPGRKGNPHNVRHARLIPEEVVLAKVHNRVVLGGRHILGNVPIAADEGQDASVEHHTLPLVEPYLRVDKPDACVE